MVRKSEKRLTYSGGGKRGSREEATSCRGPTSAKRRKKRGVVGHATCRTAAKVPQSEGVRKAARKGLHVLVAFGAKGNEGGNPILK